MTRVIGVDPGPTPGIVMLWDDGGEPWVVQCSLDACQFVVASMLWARVNGEEQAEYILAVEKFVVGNRASRSSSAKAGEQTRDLVANLKGLSEEIDKEDNGVSVAYVERRASEVKPWATEKRLEKSGLLALTKGMTHARDASRHALFAAAKAGLLPDPLSKKAAA